MEGRDKLGRYIKGRKLSEKEKDNLKKIRLKYLSNPKIYKSFVKYMKKNPPSFLGHRHSSKSKMKLSQNNARYWKGKKRPKFSKKWCENISKSNLGNKKSEKHCQNISKSMIGISPFSKGKHLSEKHRNNIIKANRKNFINKYKSRGIDKSLLKKLYLDEDLTIQNISDIFRLPFHTIRSLLIIYNIQRKKTCVTQKKLWSNADYRNKQIKMLRKSSSIRPTRPEKIVLQICQLNNLPFNYVGDGKVIINGFNPDFIDKDSRKIIEVNGFYWHNLPENRKRDILKKSIFRRMGYAILFLKELDIYKNPQKIVEKLVNLHQT